MNLAILLDYISFYQNEYVPNAYNRSVFTLSSIQKMESEYVITQLKSFSKDFSERVQLDSNAKLTSQEVDWLANFLSSRWNRIQNTNSCYTLDSLNPANVLCISLARELAETQKMNFFQLLMPTIQSIANPSPAGLEEYTNKTNIGQFILTDENTHLIFVQRALFQLKYENIMTKEIDGLSSELTESEIDRVIRHSNSARKYHITLVELEKLRAKKDSIGHALDTLKGILEESYKNEENFQENVKFKDFMEYFAQTVNQLNSYNRDILLNAAYIYDSVDNLFRFQHLWAILSNKELETDPARHIDYNIDILRNILLQNSILYQININSKRKVSEQIIKTHAKYDQIEEDFISIYSHKTDNISFHYPKAESKFILSILSDEVGVKIVKKNKKYLNQLRQLTEEDRDLCLAALSKSDKREESLKATNLETLQKSERLKDVTIDFDTPIYYSSEQSMVEKSTDYELEEVSIETAVNEVQGKTQVPFEFRPIWLHLELSDDEEPGANNATASCDDLKLELIENNTKDTKTETGKRYLANPSQIDSSANKKRRITLEQAIAVKPSQPERQNTSNKIKESPRFFSAKKSKQHRTVRQPIHYRNPK